MTMHAKNDRPHLLAAPATTQFISPRFNLPRIRDEHSPRRRAALDAFWGPHGVRHRPDVPLTRPSSQAMQEVRAARRAREARDA